MVRPRIDEVSVTGHGVYPNDILASSERTRWSRSFPRPVAADPDTLARFERKMSSARGQAHPSTYRSGESRAIWRLQEEKVDDSNARSSRVLSFLVYLRRLSSSSHDPKVEGSNPSPATKFLSRRDVDPGVLVSQPRKHGKDSLGFARFLS